MQLYKFSKIKNTMIDSKNFSTLESVSFLEIELPIIAPETPPKHITIRPNILNCGIEFVKIVVNRLAPCEKSMMNSEFFAETFGDIEKK